MPRSSFSSITRSLILPIILLSLPATARAHFVFLVPESGSLKARIIFSETLNPDEQVDIALIAGAKLFLRDAAGRDSPLSLTKADHAFLTPIAAGTRLLHGTVDLGITQRGESKPNLLLYYPKTILGNPFAPKNSLGTDTPVELIPTGKPGAWQLQLLAQGKPLPKAEITLLLPDGSQQTLTTDDHGQTGLLKQSGRFGAWARYWQTTPGERDGKKYEEIRRYATLVMDVPDASPASSITPVAAESALPSAATFATMPQPASSFGAVAADGWLYLYGGHIAPTHSYSTDAVSGQFHRLKLSDPATWEQLPSGPAMQGMNLAAHNGKIYRIGGMQPHNKPNTPADNFSTADCAQFDPATKTWQPFPPLPQPRSSHDVVVLGSKLLVVGGWTLNGSAPTQWPDSALELDLSAQKPEWKTFSQPFHRRALIAAPHNNKLYVMGGFNENSQITRSVDIYDLQTQQWSHGPELPAPDDNAFGPAACSLDSRLYVSLADGTLYRLTESPAQWTPIAAATPRIVHRLIPAPSQLLILGGASNGDNSDLIESVKLSPR